MEKLPVFLIPMIQTIQHAYNAFRSRPYSSDTLLSTAIGTKGIVEWIVYYITQLDSQGEVICFYVSNHLLMKTYLSMIEKRLQTLQWCMEVGIVQDQYLVFSLDTSQQHIPCQLVFYSLEESPLFGVFDSGYGIAIIDGQDTPEDQLMQLEYTLSAFPHVFIISKKQIK